MTKAFNTVPSRSAAYAQLLGQKLSLMRVQGVGAGPGDDTLPILQALTAEECLLFDYSTSFFPHVEQNSCHGRAL
ncbi:hypothetical protein EYZ11_010559 [Aspergillus tanneri]|uniref:Uncharacterized protein n=1 Tax=Aspergillus tanneri TaxID=1220188 RepID=A0A4S3J5D6_9EURO|nr:hypothetical protein EYZ11_010559 [Aspergillus tanneri]